MANPVRRPDDYPTDHRPGGKVPAWAVSMLLHVVLIIALALWMDRRPSGQGNQPDRAVGVAVAHRMADRTVYETVEADNSDTESDSNDSASAAAAAAASTAPSAAQPIDVDGLLAAITDTPMPDSGQGSGSALEAGDGAGAGPMTDGDGGGPKASTMFFGASGSGRRFAYVFDRSDSMNGKPLNAVKSELMRSMDLLGDGQSFQVIFYNNRPSYFEADGFTMLPASDSMKSRVKKFVRNIDAFGGTEHYDALRMALNLRPDVIFFLTDANIPQLNTRELDEIRNRCVEAGATIHAIEFGQEPLAPKKTFLRQLAQDNRGEYRYLNVQTLKAKAE